MRFFDYYLVDISYNQTTDLSIFVTTVKKKIFWFIRYGKPIKVVRHIDDKVSDHIEGYKFITDYYNSLTLEEYQKWGDTTFSRLKRPKRTSVKSLAMVIMWSHESVRKNKTIKRELILERLLS